MTTKFGMIRSMPRFTTAAAVLLFTAPAFAGAISVNGSCQLGNCVTPDTLAENQSISQPFNFIYTLPNGDRFQIQGILSQSNNGSNAGTQLTVTFLGYGSGAPSGKDVLTIDLLQNFAHSQTVSSATFGDGIYGGFAGPIAPSSTAERDFFVNNTALPPLGPFTPSTTLFAASNPNMVIQGIGKPMPQSAWVSALPDSGNRRVSSAYPLPCP
jgi:hypothetical protein